MDRRTFLAGAAGVGSLGLAGCTALGGGGDAPSDYDIGMGAAFFRPPELEVRAGETVVWANTGNRRHTVTAYENQIPDEATYFASGGFDSEQAARDGWMDGFEGRINAGQTYERTFEIPGEYHYFCIPHEPSGMVGKIIVTE
ncbi:MULTISPECIES: plastocyanin/azurin family copper-binding protein [Halorussus]|uniref:plastocyanin/azurin family copper-binding protein n=1 Tax=Halorussus TaxID=1070314 RepID=UPI000E212C84|nr:MULTISPECIES: plastocyanin/azurin family copper-binding protein [Halorussus]NHN58365.1 halocyanin [Halorussus sp. JP-T4]